MQDQSAPEPSAFMAVQRRLNANTPNLDVLTQRCPRCKAEPGQWCLVRGVRNPQAHLGRQDRAIHKRERAQIEAIEAGDAWYHAATTGEPVATTSGRLRLLAEADLIDSEHRAVAP